MLWHGDFSWERPIEVMAGGTTLTLSREEREWVRLMWAPATRAEAKAFQLRSAIGLVNDYKAMFDEGSN